MKKYVLTSDMFTGQVTFGYNENGYLVYYNNESDWTDTQFDWFYRVHIDTESIWLPLFSTNIQVLSQKIKGKLTEVPPDLSFEAFWNAYGRKINRKRSEDIYKKLSDAKRLKCILSIKPYLDYLSRVKWRNQADPDTYLRQEMYDSNWNQLIS